MKCKIAVVQFRVRQYAPRDNLRRVEQFVKKAAILKANIIVFPEDLLTGPIDKRQGLADTNKTYRRRFQELARRYSIDIVPGSIIEKEGGWLYNTAYYIDSKGLIKARYRKTCLWHPERRYIKPGNEVSVFYTKYGRIGLVICWDLVFEELFRKMLKQHVKLVICPSYWCYGDAGKGARYNKNSEVDFVNSLCVSRAFENEIVLVYCNAAGKLVIGNHRDRLIGRSQITAPFYGAIKRLNHSKEAMFLQEIDVDPVLRDAEQVYKIRKDLKCVMKI